MVVAALRLRASDLARTLGRVADWLLAEPRTEVAIVLVTLSSAGYFLLSTGLVGLMSNFGDVLAIAVAASCALLCRYREVPPAPRRRRRAQSKDRD